MAMASIDEAMAEPSRPSLDLNNNQIMQHNPFQSPTCLLFRLPNELIDQVVLWLQHPADLLALTRTCKYFCRVLTDRTASFMWSRTREQSIPMPIPDPLKGYTESGWAAFLFGPHKCTACNKITFALPYSFAMATHTCHVSPFTFFRLFVSIFTSIPNFAHSFILEPSI